MKDTELEYVGFWARVAAGLIDLILILLVTLPLTYAAYGQVTAPRELGFANILINYMLPAAATIVLWVKIGATPGKLAMSARIVDADTGRPLTSGMALVRYLGYFVSLIPLGVGCFWIGLDRRKQGWHDKMANSVVVRPTGAATVRFRAQDAAIDNERIEPH